MALQAWYNTGNVTIANGSPNLVGSGTLWNAFIRAGDTFSAQGLTTRVLTVIDNTHITLADNWIGTSISGGTYEIRIPPPSADITPDLRALVQALTSEIITEIGSVSFTEGDLLGYFGGVLATTPSSNFATKTGSETLTNKTINASSNTITNLTTTMFASNVVDTDVTLAANSDTRIASQKAVKSYFDNFITGLQWKTAVICATTANITLSGEQTIDGVTTSSSRVLVKNQSTGSQNGIYVSASGAWTRSTDADANAELPSATVFVEQGTVNSDTQWTCTNNTVTIGSTAVVFAQVSGAGTYSAGSGLTLTGNQFSIANNAITYALFQQVAASSLVGNATGSLANATGITIGATLAFSGTALQTAALTGDVTASANSFVTTVAKIQSTVVSGTTGSGNVVFSTSASITSPTIATATATGGTYTALTGLGVRSTGAAFDVKIAASEVLTADRTLTVILNDVNRTISLAGGLTLAAAFITSGANSLTLTTTGVTNVTLPTTGTLATLAGSETLTNKVFNASNNTVSNINTTMLAASAYDTDNTLSANSATKIPSQSAVKGYVDALVQGLAWKTPVACVATSNITLSGEQTIDGVLTSASRVLVTSQSTGSQNGIYVSSSGAWTRSTDADTGPELVWATTIVEAGTVHAGVVYTCNTTSITLGVTTPTFVVAGVSTNSISAGTGLSLSGSIMSVQTNGITYALFQQVAASSLVGNATGSLANATGITLGATLAFSGSALQTAALTGDVTASANSFATTISKIQSTTVSGTTGSGNVVFSTSPTLVTPALGTPSALTLTNATGLTPSTGLATTGTPSSSTYLRGDNSWTALNTVISNYLTGLTLSTAGSSATFSVAVGSAADSTNAAFLTLSSSISKTTSAWTVGSTNGSLDVGTIANTTWYAAYVIQRVDTGVVDVLTSLAPGTSSTVTISLASPGNVTWTKHGLQANAPVKFTTTGALPTGLTAGTQYYVKTVVDADTFTVSSTQGGTAINTSVSQSGTHTANSYPVMPTNYTLFRRLGSMKTDGSAHWLLFRQFEDNFYWDAATIDILNTAPGSTSNILVKLNVPPGVNVLPISTLRGSASAGSVLMLLACGDQTSGNQWYVLSSSGSDIYVPFNSITSNTNQQITLAASSTSSIYTFFTAGWIDHRGQ